MLASGPIIWSETRQELCESLPYYRAYQTGCYVTGALGRPPSKSQKALGRKYATLKDSIPYGYLLAGWPSRRDAWSHNGTVIISHGGGKSQVDESSGPSVAKTASLKHDQSADGSTIRALLHSSRHRLPIVLIAANNYALLPFKLACSYAVLGWYLITDGWAEREASDGDTGFVRWKFRFEWIPAQGQPWWHLPGQRFKQGWDPSQRIETFTQAQLHLVAQMRAKQKSQNSFASASSSASASGSSTSSLSSHLSSLKPLDDEERQQLLFGPIEITAELVSITSSSIDATTPCNLSYAATCINCRCPSPVIFDLGWLCLQTECTRFFRLSSGQYPAEDYLVFDPDLLRPQGDALNDAFPGGRPPFPLIPRRPSSKSMDQARGLWCRNCGRLSCRELIYRPRCAHCGHKVGHWRPLPIIPPPKLVISPFDFTAFPNGTSSTIFNPLISPSSGIVMSVRKDNGLAMYTFKFAAMFGDCCVHLIQADVDDGAREVAANQIFAEFQKHAWPVDPAGVNAKPKRKTKKGNKKRESKKKRRKIEKEALSESTKSVSNASSSDVPLAVETRIKVEQSSRPPETFSNAMPPVPPFNGAKPQHAQPRVVPFRRHTLKHHAGGSGRMLTQQFTCNYGIPYKHVVAMGTEPLDSTSPPVILSTLDLLHSRTRAILPDTQDFNELYPVLYLEHQKMSFHDDGEPGLGPIVSSLSLGSPCRMKFKLKVKHQSDFAQIKQRDRIVLDLPLRHGSVVVQQGHDLQRYFEHSVSPKGFRIAVTARRIDPLENSKGEKRFRRSTSASGSGSGSTSSKNDTKKLDRVRKGSSLKKPSQSPPKKSLREIVILAEEKFQKRKEKKYIGLKELQ
ncbi:uncharacterized protein MEPE_00285 [Melanopsichium pennsylvanicum]|uniref:Alpha-ketoglutarate-dependent dioxygenase AlkB-like domain-containing protein n=2 Tax=Melanopsichium pennsylvanicum TaxID=63383 RepID=A0AAJ4XGG5_9BASI|nr:conserved hypothetical protein [Melanopsichium pennsylvanicum 4]SNX81580.1 uncharacterized protein MEPE_00285 [Melanopsichium pennsylvanicum]